MFGPNRTRAEAHQPLAQYTCTRSELGHHVSYQVTMIGEITPVKNNALEESAIRARTSTLGSSYLRIITVMELRGTTP